MMNKNKNYFKKIYKNSKLGFTLIEVIIACAIISVTVFTLMQGAEKGIRLSNQALEKSQASLLLEEGAESVKSIRDDSWTTISNLTLNTSYYLFFNINTKKWELNNSATSIDSKFTRTITMSAVNRDANDDITSSGGTFDARTKKVTVNVSWWSPTGTITKSLSFYISDIFN